MSSSAVLTQASLLDLTAALPADAFFLEHSREREIAYIKRSFQRWNEMIDLALTHLPAPSNLSCLDIGASPFTFLLKEVFGKVSALDLTDALKARCEAAGIRLYDGGVTKDENLADVEKVDCVFFLEVIEHLHANPVKVLRRVRSLLKPGGLMVLTTPNMACFANRVRMLFNRKLRHLDYPPFALEDEAHGFGHDRIFMPQELAEYGVAAGFQKVELAYQMNRDGTGASALQRAVAWGPHLAKVCFPSMQDGLVLLGNNPS